MYSGQCAEFCGLSHAIMAMSAVAVPPAEFDAWVAKAKQAFNKVDTPAEPAKAAAEAPVSVAQDGARAGAR